LGNAVKHFARADEPSYKPGAGFARQPKWFVNILANQPNIGSRNKFEPTPGSPNPVAPLSRIRSLTNSRECGDRDLAPGALPQRGIARGPVVHHSLVDTKPVALHMSKFEPVKSPTTVDQPI
jgi:hypothetical protein